MRIIVTGASGFIGTNLYNKLYEQGHTVVGVDPIANNEIVGIHPAQHYLHKLQWEADVIFHLGAYIDVQESLSKPKKYFQNNIDATIAVLEYARKYGSKVIYAGSASKHTNPYLSPYASSKYIGEELCKTYKTCYDLDIEIARFYNVFGPGEKVSQTDASVIGIWRWCVEQGIDLPIIGDGEQRRDFIHVDDVTDALITIMEGVSTHDDAWEIGTGTSTSINELYKMFVNKFNVGFELRDDQQGNARLSTLENDDMNDRFGWRAKKKVVDYIINDI